MSQQMQDSNEKADSRSQVSSVISADAVEGEMVGVLMDQLTDGTEVSNIQEVGAVSGRLVGVQIGTGTGGTVASDQRIGAVSGAMIGAEIGEMSAGAGSVNQKIDMVDPGGTVVGAQIGTLGGAPATSQPAPSGPPAEPVGLAGRIRAWLARVFR
jgi:hypothetical protein